MQISSRSITALLILGCWGGLAAHSSQAQGHQSPSELFEKLQSEQTTDQARNELEKLGRSDPGVRQFLITSLPPLIDSGPRMATCPGYPCRAWENAVELAGSFKIGEAASALARWITVKDLNPWPGIRPYGERRETNLTAIALTRIGDSAIPALQQVVTSGSVESHAVAVRVLCTIHTPKAKAVLREDLPHESDPSLQEMIKTVLGEK